MAVDAPKPVAAPDIDYADETLADTSYVFIPQPELRALTEAQDDVVELDDIEVNELLNKIK